MNAVWDPGANSNPPWIANWNGADIRRKWKAVQTSALDMA
jgi:hypothetical protein